MSWTWIGSISLQTICDVGLVTISKYCSVFEDKSLTSLQEIDDRQFHVGESLDELSSFDLFYIASKTWIKRHLGAKFGRKVFII